MSGVGLAEKTADHDPMVFMMSLIQSSRILAFQQRIMPDTFTPPYLLCNPHIQTILASFRPRKYCIARRAGALLRAAGTHILDSGNGVRLLGSYSSRPENRKGLVVMIHGWEGSIDSSYLLSAAGVLFAHGFNIFRLNLRDHGESHHLNRELFASTRLDEVVNGVAEVVRLFPHKKKFLAGFSLGGNFALRIGLRAPLAGLSLDKIVAVSPLISPMNTTLNLEKNLFFYHAYFVSKWRRSLQKKLLLFPDLGYSDTILQRRSLGSMNEYFVPNHTGYASAASYLDAYGLTGDKLAAMQVDSHIIAAEDDPITRIQDLALVTACPPSIRFEITQYGGHCGFLQDFSLNSWVDRRLVSLFSLRESDVLDTHYCAAARLKDSSIIQ